MKKVIYLVFTLVIFFNLIFVSDTFAFYSCEEKATDLVKIQSEIDGLNAQKNYSRELAYQFKELGLYSSW